MQAIQITRFGGPEVLTLAEVATPVPGPGQVLIRVAAAGVNFAETLMREDRYVAAYTLPAIPGSEIAGTIEALGDGVEDLRIGQRVGAVLAAAKVLTGGYAQYCVAEAAVTAPLPDGLSFDHAAALLVQGLTALFLVREVSPEGRDVLVTAAGGGVGSLLIQLARLHGARSVTAAASSEAKRSLAASLGADLAVDYEGLSRLAPTMIYDSVGGVVLPKCLEILAPKGTLVAYGALNLQDFSLGLPELKRMVFANQTFRGFAFGPLVQQHGVREPLGELFDLAARGVLKTNITAAPLARAAAVHRTIRDRASIGKMVLRPFD